MVRKVTRGPGVKSVNDGQRNEAQMDEKWKNGRGPANIQRSISDAKSKNFQVASRPKELTVWQLEFRSPAPHQAAASCAWPWQASWWHPAVHHWASCPPWEQSLALNPRKPACPGLQLVSVVWTVQFCPGLVGCCPWHWASLTGLVLGQGLRGLLPSCWQGRHLAAEPYPIWTLCFPGSYFKKND